MPESWRKEGDVIVNVPPASWHLSDKDKLVYLFSVVFYVAWKRGLPRKFARFVLLRLIKKRSFNLLCVLDLFFRTLAVNSVSDFCLFVSETLTKTDFCHFCFTRLPSAELSQNSPLLNIKFETAHLNVIQIEKKKILYFHSYTRMPVCAQCHCKHN